MQASSDYFGADRHTTAIELSRVLDGVDTLARVVSLHDGDTLTAVVPLFGRHVKVHVRVAGIDTCEMNATDDANRRLAFLARDRMLQLVLGDDHAAILLSPPPPPETTRPPGGRGRRPPSDKARIDALLDGGVYMVRLRCGRFEKYGRVLAKVFGKDAGEDDPSFGDVLVAEGLAYEYRGGRKLTEAEQLRACACVRMNEARMNEARSFLSHELGAFRSQRPDRVAHRL